MNTSQPAFPTPAQPLKPPAGLGLPVGQVHVWQVSLAEAAGWTAQFWPMLNATERNKALHRQGTANQNRAIVSRGLLRTLLAWYLQTDPAAVPLAASASAKPALSAVQGLEFNVAHSSDVILYAFTCGRRVGVDIEQVKALPELLDVAERFFSPREFQLLRALPAVERTSIFYRLWTLKEAFVKMQGTGLTEDFRQLDLLSVLKEHDDWVFETFAPVPEHLAAVVMEGSVRWPVQFRAFREITQ